jgi:[protein-PII] uridylyltransferase
MLERYLEERADTGPVPAVSAGLERCHVISDALDEGIVELTRDAGFPVALVAVGGYGRREQCRHSDIDITLLVPGRISSADRERAGRLLYPLWDADLKVGHSIRSVTESVRAARENVETLTALVDARFVGGASELFDALQGAMGELVVSQRASMHRELSERRADRVREQPWQLQTVDVKVGRGGLRDLHMVHWRNIADARASGITPPGLPEPLIDARDTLLATRNALHAHMTRPGDVYREDLAPLAAEWLGSDLATWSRALSLAMRTVDAAAAGRTSMDVTAETAPRRRFAGLLRRRPGRRDPEPQAVMESPPAPPPGDEDEDVADALRQLMHELRRIADTGTRPAADAGRPLDPLPRSEWLDRVLPEWEVLRARRHIAPFHVHPVDVHAARTVAEAHRAATTDEENTGSVEAAGRLEHSDDLLVAALLHDIGKGHEASHVEAGAVLAERFADRVGLPPDRARLLTRAVALHLLLPAVATRRDIADVDVIRDVAEQVGEARLLHLLYILAIADARASGGDVWNAWKGQLLRSLYSRVLDYMDEHAVLGPDSTEATLHAVSEMLGDDVERDLIREHIEQLGPSYLVSSEAASIALHIELIAEARSAADGTALRVEPAGVIDRLTLVANDRPGLLHDVAGTLAASNASVLGGVAFTRDDGMAIEVWHVSDALGHGIDDARWQRIGNALRQAVAGEFPVAERVAATREAYARREQPRVAIATTVSLDNDVSADYSVIEVATADRPGLLHAITSSLHELGVNIHLAKVDTIGPEVVDAFYVDRAGGHRIELDTDIAGITDRIRQAIAELDRGDASATS